MARPRKQTGKTVPSFTDEFGERLEYVISRIGKLEQVSAKSGASRDQLISWKFGRSRPDFFALATLCDLAGVSINWLATGSGPRNSSDETLHVAVRTQQEQTSMQRVDPITLDPSEMRLVPVLDVRASAGTGIVAHSEEVAAFVAFTDSYLREIGVNPKFSEILQVSGRSMLPTLADRDWVLIDRSIDKVLDEALYAVVYGGMVLVKRVRLSRDGSVTLCSDNKGEGYEDELIRPSDLHTLNIVGRVKAHCRPL